MKYDDLTIRSVTREGRLYVERLSWHGLRFRIRPKVLYGQHVFVERGVHSSTLSFNFNIILYMVASLVVCAYGAYLYDTHHQNAGIAMGVFGALLIVAWLPFVNYSCVKIMTVDEHSIVVEYRRWGRQIRRNEYLRTVARLGIHQWEHTLRKSQKTLHGWTAVVHLPDDHFALIASVSQAKVDRYVEALPESLKKLYRLPERSIDRRLPY